MGHGDPGYKEIYYRIVPSELPWWKRWFFNPWRKFFMCYPFSGILGELFTPDEYIRLILPLKTLEDVCKFHANENAKYNKFMRMEEERHAEDVRRGKSWPDD